MAKRLMLPAIVLLAAFFLPAVHAQDVRKDQPGFDFNNDQPKGVAQELAHRKWNNSPPVKSVYARQKNHAPAPRRHHIGIAFVPHTPDVQYGEPIWERVQRDADLITIPGQKQSGANTVVRDAIGGGFQDTYVPGHTISDYRHYNAARFIPANTDVYLNLHYTPNGKPLRTHVRVGFTVAKEPPERQVVMVPVGGPTDRDHFRIPANDPDYAAPPGEATFARDVEIFSLMPHMHVRGKSMTFTLTYPDGRAETVLNVPRYDFNWQLQYDTSIKVPKGTKLRVEAHYDNSAGNRYNPNPNRDVFYGEQTWEEMESGYVFVLVNDPDFDPRHPDLIEKSTRVQAAR